MTVSVSLVKVGNSNAFIIPAKILKKMNLKNNSRFELSLEDDSSLRIRKISSRDEVVFPKVKIPAITEQEMEQLVEKLVVVDKERIKNDERLSYILSR